MIEVVYNKSNKSYEVFISEQHVATIKRKYKNCLSDIAGAACVAYKFGWNDAARLGCKAYSRAHPITGGNNEVN